MPQLFDDVVRKPEQQIFLVALVCGAVLLAALGLQHIGGYQPCELCLKERYAYYAGLILAVGASAAMGMGRNGFAAALMAVAGVLLAANAGLGLYHAGIEWHWWAGPTACTADSNGLAATGDDLLKAIENQNVVRCDQPALKIAGLSLAAWNVPIGLGLGAIAALAAWQLSRSKRTVA